VRGASKTKRRDRPARAGNAPKTSRAHFDRIAGKLRTQLLSLQDQLKSKDFSVLLLLAGSAVAGKDESLNLIAEWMDPRWIITRAYGPPTGEEAQRPTYWRYWRDLPPKGQIGLFAGSWYHQPVQNFALGKIGKRNFYAGLDEVRSFEKTLTDAGTLILKFWLHMSKAEIKKRMKEFEKDKTNSWRISKLDWEHLKHHRKLHKAHALAADYTNAEGRRWVLVDGTDPRHRALTILTTIRDALAAQIKSREARDKRVARARQEAERIRRDQLIGIKANLGNLEKQSQMAAKAAKSESGKSPAVAGDGLILDQLDLSMRLNGDEYERSLQERRAELGKRFRRMHFEGKSAIVLFEGPDAAGKGGAIRRLIGSMDARDYRVIQIAAPTEEERAQHYLWRFWKHVPQPGRVTIYDRSWYGRVLVERVEGFTPTDDWMRGYDEINEFERQLTSNGILVVKFWIHISKEEQFRRFKERETISYKKWKLTAEDWRNREKWNDYGVAVHDMIGRTSTEHAPWTLVEGNDKKFARIKVMDTVCHALRRAAKDGE
jgi:polyphosphate kinase 2 (PPK2 family)